MPFEGAEPHAFRRAAHPDGHHDREPSRRVTLLVAVAVAWLGLLAHNQLSLPIAVLSAENLGPLLVYAALAAWYARSRGGGLARGALGGWTLVNLVAGGVLTVLPLPFLPFAPEQTAAHYAAHAIYAATQLPLLAIVLRPTPRRRAE